MKNSIKIEIIKYLEERGGWVFGGILEREIGDLMLCKSSNVSRRCRELVAENQIDSSKVQVDGKGPYCVRYGIFPKQNGLFI